MARACLALSLTEFAKICGVSEKTLRRCEASFGPPAVHDVTIARVRAAFEAYGVSFTGSIELGVIGVLVDVPKCLGPHRQGETPAHNT